MIEMLMFIMLICLVVGMIARYKINESSKRIKELEEKLDGCYIEREQRLRGRGLITGPQDTPAICEYSGLRPVEGYQEEIDKEIIKVIIADLDTEEGKEKAECFRRGWLAGYDKGLYDGQYK